MMDSVLQCVQPPTTNVNRMPTVKNSWKNAPKAPRIEVSAISPIYIGAATHIPPRINEILCYDYIDIIVLANRLPSHFENVISSKEGGIKNVVLGK